MLIKLTVKYFNSILRAFFIVTGKLFETKILYIRLPIPQLKELFLSLLFRRYGAFYLQHKETILIKSSLLCETSVKFAHKFKSLTSNNGAF